MTKTVPALVALVLSSSAFGCGDGDIRPADEPIGDIESALGEAGCHDHFDYSFNDGAGGGGACPFSSPGTNCFSTTTNNTYGTATCPHQYSIAFGATASQDWDWYANIAAADSPPNQTECEATYINIGGYTFTENGDYWQYEGGRILRGHWNTFLGGWCTFPYSSGTGGLSEHFVASSNETAAAVAVSAYRSYPFGAPGYRKVTGGVIVR